MSSDGGQRFVTVEECEAMINRAVAEALLKVARAPRPFKVFGLNATSEYSKKVSEHMRFGLTPHTEKVFEDGECYVKSGPEFSDSNVGNVRGHNVFVIQSLFADEQESVADKFIKLCFFCGSLKDASAHEVIPIIPHLAWARQDRKTESRAPITTKYVARMLEANKIDRALFIDVHNLAAEQNAFNVPIDVLEAKNSFAQWFASNMLKDGHCKKIKVLSPDAGGVSRCERFRNALLSQLNKQGSSIDDIEIVIFDKLRVKNKVVSSGKGNGRIIGDVADADVIAYDDMISTAGTMKKACKAVIDHGGRVYAICATHGLFCGDANKTLNDLDTKIVVADTVDPWRLTPENMKKVQVIDTTKMVADAILKIHSGSGSISELLRI